MKKIIAIILLFISVECLPQSPDVPVIKSVFDEALRNGKSYEMLHFLTKNIGQRLSGSEGAAKSVTWGQQVMKDSGFDSVWLQPIMVPHWVRGQKEVGLVTKPGSAEKFALNICALGGSVGTGPAGLKGKIIEVKGIKDMASLKNAKGKIVFFNRPMDPTMLNTFSAYSHAVDQRAYGPSVAAKMGAIAVIVRSMGLNAEDYPHTGALVYAADTAKIPAVAVSTKHADVLSQWIKTNKDVEFYLETHCEMLEDVQSHNVVGEVKGSEFPEEIILVGGHLDSWDLGEGAHDDGAGCVQSIEAIRLLVALGYKPKRTLRAVLFMNEENGTRGGTKYAELALAHREKHIMAIESDRGGFAPRGFTMTATDLVKAIVKSWKPLLEPYGLTDFSQSGGGADIEALSKQGVPVMEFLPDSQRYFDLHHTSEDRFENVNKRELELGAASLAAMIYLIDQHGLK